MRRATDTIAAIATPPGRGGVGIIRLSGPAALAIGQAVVGWPESRAVEPRHAYHLAFRDVDGSVLDEGLWLYFRAPASFTGEDVIELQGHGGPVILDLLLRRVLSLGARLARPGEFSERAFLNDKLDLAQAEAVADLIDAASEQAARSAVRSLQGEFSRRIDALVEALIALRIYVEAAIDFPDEEVDFLADEAIGHRLAAVQAELATVQHQAGQGALLKEGMTVVIAGPPNAGKSSLLNALAGHEAAIVTDIAGTTRDVLREHIHLDGLPLHIIDTAGLRDSPDVVEQEGIRRAYRAIEQADIVLLVYDGSQPEISPLALARQFFQPLPARLFFVRNKLDLLPTATQLTDIHSEDGGQWPVLSLSARSGLGLQALKEALKRQVGYRPLEGGSFLARRRHLDAIARAEHHLFAAEHQLKVARAGELVAEELRLAQQALGEITGQFSADDLLGRIFASFCIGK